MFFGGGFPGFEHAHSGGHGGGHREVDNSEYYELLEVEKTATPAEIKKSYRRLAIKHHPDKGGDQETFKKISEAYDVLGTPEKKELYDKYGKEGVEQGGGMSSAEDVFSRFFGGGGRSKPAGPAKSKDLVHEISVTLEELYSGKKRKLAVARKRATYPEGMKPEDAVSTCTQCKGQGVQTRMQRVGPGMIQQFQVKCDTCNGTGKIYNAGVKIEKMKAVLEVFIEPGMKDGQKIVFSGEADELPGMLAGDVIFLLREKPHTLFKRKGADLLIEKEISLKQALCGFSYPIKHLDGRTIVVQRKPGEVIAPQALKAISDLGMPIHKRSFEHGRLFIFFKVEFPKTLTEKQCTLISQSLPVTKVDEADAAEMKKTKPDAEVVDKMMDMDPDDIGKVKAAHATAHAYDSDEEEEGGGQHKGVQCQQS